MRARSWNLHIGGFFPDPSLQVIPQVPSAIGRPKSLDEARKPLILAVLVKPCHASRPGFNCLLLL